MASNFKTDSSESPAPTPFDLARASIEQAKQALFELDVTRLRLAREIKENRERPISVFPPRL